MKYLLSVLILVAILQVVLIAHNDTAVLEQLERDKKTMQDYLDKLLKEPFEIKNASAQPQQQQQEEEGNINVKVEAERSIVSRGEFQNVLAKVTHDNDTALVDMKVNFTFYDNDGNSRDFMSKTDRNGIAQVAVEMGNHTALGTGTMMATLPDVGGEDGITSWKVEGKGLEDEEPETVNGTSN